MHHLPLASVFTLLGDEKHNDGLLCLNLAYNVQLIMYVLTVLLKL